MCDSSKGLCCRVFKKNIEWTEMEQTENIIISHVSSDGNDNAGVVWNIRLGTERKKFA